jgi:hypothetical protein
VADLGGRGRGGGSGGEKGNGDTGGLGRGFEARLRAYQ